MSDNQSNYPGWAYLLAGLAIGLFVAFLVYLHNLPEPDETAAAEPPESNPNQPAPEFDFYEILPELEVVVPDLKTGGDKKQKTEAQPEPPSPSPELDKDEHFILQAGSFNDFQQADRLKASLALLGVEAHIQNVTVDNKSWHRVRIGPFEDRKTLNSVRARLKANEIEAITLKVNR